MASQRGKLTALVEPDTGRSSGSTATSRGLGEARREKDTVVGMSSVEWTDCWCNSRDTVGRGGEERWCGNGWEGIRERWLWCNL